MKFEIDISDNVVDKLDVMSKILKISKEEVVNKLVSENSWESREKIIEDVKGSSQFVEWSKINLKDGQTFYGDIVNFVEDGDMSKIVLQNEFQELEYEIYIDLIASIEHHKGLDKNEYFIQPRKLKKED